MFRTFEGVVKEGSSEHKLLTKIDPDRIPFHLAVIMDGNGRWANSREMTRIEGHKAGAESAKKITEYCARLGVKHLTLFTFSSENWKRPVKEVNALMEMLNHNLLTQKDLLIKNDIKFSVIGDLEKLPKKIRKSISETIKLSENHKTMNLHLALNYGGRAEIINAVKKIVEAKVRPEKVNEKIFSKFMYDKELPDPDLLIRTSGEVRISNFLLYQIAYTELFFTDTLWPDFNLKGLLEAIIDFQNRDRRYGKL